MSYAADQLRKHLRVWHRITKESDRKRVFEYLEDLVESQKPRLSEREIYECQELLSKLYK